MGARLNRGDQPPTNRLKLAASQPAGQRGSIKWIRSGASTGKQGRLKKRTPLRHVKRDILPFALVATSVTTAAASAPADVTSAPADVTSSTPAVIPATA